MSSQRNILLVLLWLVVFPVASKSLPEIVQQAHQRLQRAYAVNPDVVSENADVVNRWLQGPVSVQINALKSQSRLGTDEYEIGLSLPFRSPQGKALDEQQSNLLTSLEQARQRRFSLLVSGLVREALWRRLVANETLSGLQAKMQWVDEFDQTLQKQYELGEVDRATLLRWKQEKLSHRLAVHKARLTLQQATDYYQTITGTEILPEQPEEGVIAAPKERLSGHPELRLLSLSQSQLSLTLRQADQQLSPWTLGVIGRHLNGPNGNENLLGLSVNIPLPMGSSNSVGDYASWRDASSALADASAQTYSMLAGQLSDAQRHYAYLQEANGVLTEKVAIGDDIISLFEQQQSSLPRLVWLEQMIEQQDLRVEARTNRILLNEAAAKINQVAGISL